MKPQTKKNQKFTLQTALPVRLAHKYQIKRNDGYNTWGERRRPAEVVSDRDQLYLAHAQCLTKKSVQWGRKSPAKSGATAQ